MLVEANCSLLDSERVRGTSRHNPPQEASPGPAQNAPGPLSSPLRWPVLTELSQVSKGDQTHLCQGRVVGMDAQQLHQSWNDVHIDQLRL